MKRRGLVVALMASLALSAIGVARAQEVSLSPATIATPDVGKTLALTVNVAAINDLFGWQIDVVYDSKVLKFTKFTEGGFLKAVGASFPVPAKDRDIAAGADGLNRSVTVGATLLGGSAKGGGDLGIVEFEVVARSASTVKLAAAKFLDPAVKEIAVTTKPATLTAAPVNQPPKANAGANQTAKAGVAVALDASTSTDADGTIAKYDWDFGDASTGTGAKVTHVYAKPGTYAAKLTVTDDKGATASATVTITVTGEAPIREHAKDSPALRLTATFPQADGHGHAYVAIWTGELKIEAGQVLEYQVFMASGNPAFQASVDMAAADGTTLRDVKTAAGVRAVDQNGLNAHPASDLSKNARDAWYHRQIKLDALVGKTISGITLAVDSDTHRAGVFNAYFDNIQITDGTNRVKDIYIDGAQVPLPTPVAVATAPGNGGVQGMTEPSVTASVVTVAVSPRGKLSTTWADMKSK